MLASRFNIQSKNLCSAVVFVVCFEIYSWKQAMLEYFGKIEK